MWCLVLLIAIAWAVGWFLRDRQTISRLSDKHVFVTGCDTGFGNLLAKRLNRKGFHVLAGCLTQSGADNLQKACPVGLKTTLLDVTNCESIKKAVEWVKAEVGSKGLYGLVNNAGIANPIGPTEWMTIEDYRRVMEVNTFGTIGVTLHFLPLVKQARGRIVNMASVLGRISANGGGYCVSKYAVEAFSDSLRRDIQHFGVKVCIIEPGFFKTAVTDLDSIEKSLQKLWDQMPAETRRSYGDVYYQKCMFVTIQSPISHKYRDCAGIMYDEEPESSYTAARSSRTHWHVFGQEKYKVQKTNGSPSHMLSHSISATRWS